MLFSAAQRRTQAGSDDSLNHKENPAVIANKPIKPGQSAVAIMLNLHLHLPKQLRHENIEEAQARRSLLQKHFQVTIVLLIVRLNILR